MSKSILVYTDGEVIGDGIIKLPFAAVLKNAFPGSHLTWLAGSKSAYSSSLKELASPILDRLIELPAQKLRWTDLLKKPVLERHFDLVIDTQGKFKRTLWLHRIPHSTFISASTCYLLSDIRPGGMKIPEGTIFDGLMTLASLAAGQKLQATPLKLPHPQWQALAEKLLPPGAHYIGFVPGAGQPFKRWPLDLFLKLAQQQEEKGFVPVMLLGPQEDDMVPAIRANLPTVILPLSDPAAGKDPSLTIALGQRLAATVANDSGGGHLIAAGGSPMVSLFRSSSVRKKFTPTAPRVVALAPEDFSGNKMEHIPLEAVTAALEKVL